MAKCEKILLVGFSGAGKSNLLKELTDSAPDPRWSFSDLDHLIIDSRRVQSIAELVETHGWEKFRLWERQRMEEWLKEDGAGVLSLGGGALSQLVLDLYKDSRKIAFCHLDAPFDDCWERLHFPGAELRPLTQLGKSELHRIYSERQKLFRQVRWRIENPKGSNLNKLAQIFWKELP